MITRMEQLRNEIHALARKIERRISIMEVCGTHTVSIFRHGLRSMLPANLRLISGPGCPVCVTAQRHIDAAIELTRRPDVILATYGDMMRVPGRRTSLEKRRADGANIQVVNSAETALQLADEYPDQQVVFMAIGFETTAPATAAVVLQAERRNIQNFSVLVSHKQVVPAMLALLRSGDVPLDGFICPGHVSVIIGARAYEPIVRDHRKPCVVAGFEPDQILSALVSLLRQIADKRAKVENVYSAVVSEVGNTVALDLMKRVFVSTDTPWRALGTIAQSGLELAPAYQKFDALRRFQIQLGSDEDDPRCLCGEVIQGKVEPHECPLFAGECTPLTPIGPCMVSSEGTCAAWYKYHRTVNSSSHRERSA